MKNSHTLRIRTICNLVRVKISVNKCLRYIRYCIGEFQLEKQALGVRCNDRDADVPRSGARAATSPLHTAPGNYRARRGRGRSPVKGSRAARPTPVLNVSEEPVPHLITCNQFRDLHAFTSAPPLD